MWSAAVVFSGSPAPAVGNSKNRKKSKTKTPFKNGKSGGGFGSIFVRFWKIGVQTQ
jgi:hypothetical protein